MYTYLLAFGTNDSMRSMNEGNSAQYETEFHSHIPSFPRIFCSCCIMYKCMSVPVNHPARDKSVHTGTRIYFERTKFTFALQKYIQYIILFCFLLFFFSFVLILTHILYIFIKLFSVAVYNKIKICLRFRYEATFDKVKQL